MNNMQQLFSKAQKLQEKIAQTQKQLETQETTGASGAGLVNVQMTLGGVVRSISIDPSLLNVDEKEMLEDLIVAALNDAKTKADKLFEDGMKEVTGGLDLGNLPGGLF